VRLEILKCTPLLIWWQRNGHEVHMLTTRHYNEMKTTGKNQQKMKPTCGMECNKNWAMMTE
jgi:hypothetical protein